MDISTAALLHAGIEERDVETTGLRVTLAFHEAADLDLYVTDPLQETVYFANTPTRSGGRLDGDRRCDDRPPRAETVYFATPLPGRYRIGIDYPERCSGREPRAVFLVAIEADGRRAIRRGLIRRLVFEPAFWEFEIERREVEHLEGEPLEIEPSE